MKKLFIGLGAGTIIAIAAAVSGSTTAPQQNSIQPVAVPQQVVLTTPIPVAPSVVQQNTAPTSNSVSNDNYYTNTYGNSVHSPAYTNDNSVPAGASARCRDGTYSFSQSRRGTCSHHGGVADWL